MHVSLQRITPDIATQYLEHNKTNRNFKKSRVARYAREMTRGQWLQTGDPIRFDTNGDLIDGQNRLLAIIEAGVTLDMYVIRGLEPKSYTVLDSGLARTWGDALGRDTAQATHKAAICRVLLCVDLGGDPRDTRDLEVVTRVDCEEFYHEHEAVIDNATQVGSSVYKAFVGGNRTAWGAFVVMAGDRNALAAYEFVDGVRTGADLAQGSPILALRNFLSNNRQLPNAGYHLALLIKAWNGWLAGQARTVMVVRADEEFPTMRERRVTKKVAS